MSSDPNSPLTAVRREIARAAGARPVQLVAVSKTQPIERIDALAAQGQRDFAENYVQELVAKQRLRPALVWHQIGPLQSNKAAAVAEHADWLQSLDRAKLLPILDRARSEKRAPLNVLIQVNIDGEASKSGVTPEAIDELAAAVCRYPRLRLRGLMAIPSPDPDFGRRRLSFERMAACFAELSRQYPTCDTLSLGMSEDYPLAIAAGATMVRVGSALFGPRG